jgi:hypothetical protein
MNAKAQLREQLSDTIKAILDSLPEGVIPADLRYFKTTAYYDQALTRNVVDLYNGQMSESEFVDDLARLIDEQFTRAFNEGMRNNDLDPAKDMTDAWESLLQDRKLTEFDYVDNFASQIVQAAKDGADIGPFKDRASLWAHRYDEVVSWSQIVTRPDDRYKWVVGPTEHCDTCAMLNGIVATGKDWLESGYRPQGDMLICKGFNCQCEWVYTEEKATEGGIPGA